MRIGVNSRLDTIQAAILIEKLKVFPDELLARDKVASAYEEGIGKALRTPRLAQGLSSAWAQYTVIVEERDAVQAKLKELGVPSVVYYPKALTQQDGYSFFPIISSGVVISEWLSGKVLSLPMHPYLSAIMQAGIIEKVLRVIDK